MTPKDKAIIILEATRGDNAIRARLAFRGCTPEQMQELYGESGETRQAILDSYEKEEAEHQSAIDWARSMPISVTLESTPVDHDGDCNILNGADGAGCNCTARERQKMQDRITELEAERNDFKRALDDLGVTPEEARKGAERSREKDRRIVELEKYIKERSSPLFVVSPVELSAEDMARLKLAMNTSMPIEIVRHGMTIHEMTQLVCGELPEGYELKIAMENGAGEAVLYLPNEGYIDGTNLADAGIEKQIVELVKLAKGEPSEYDPEQP